MLWLLTLEMKREMHKDLLEVLACQYLYSCYLELSSNSRLLDCHCQLDLLNYYFPLAKGTECRKSISKGFGRSLAIYHLSEYQAGQLD